MYNGIKLEDNHTKQNSLTCKHTKWELWNIVTKSLQRMWVASVSHDIWADMWNHLRQIKGQFSSFKSALHEFTITEWHQNYYIKNCQNYRQFRGFQDHPDLFLVWPKLKEERIHLEQPLGLTAYRPTFGSWSIESQLPHLWEMVEIN